ncbi:hypothetical protein JTB14_024500 [Gonioctena quinquepunctata]|nr:hypothetical protein JTB14_024500 [Gonioctena quinquepunctata]
MCWYPEVFFGVLGNLTGRLFADLLHVAYMCYFRCCAKGFDEEYGDEFIKETTEEFFKEVSREYSEILLENRQNGTFIIRPSKNSNLGTMSVIQDNKIFHLSIRRREDGFIALGNEKTNEKCFKDMDSLINYYISNHLVLYSDGDISQTLLIPFKEYEIMDRYF